MKPFDAANTGHLAIVRDAAIEAWLNVVGVCRAIREALEDENIGATEEAYSVGLAALGVFKEG